MSLVCRVIPCLDVAGGRVVKGVNFQNLRDMGDPVELAREYFRQGADEITFLDVTATVDERATTYDVVRRTAEEVFIPLTVGGGVRSVDDVARLVGLASDNWATNVLLQRVGGVGQVAATAEAAGLRGVALHDRVRDERTQAHPPTLRPRGISA